jgi:hypothetical protein
MRFSIAMLPSTTPSTPRRWPARWSAGLRESAVPGAQRTSRAIPTSRKSLYPGGGELPRRYVPTYDPLVALTAAAMAIERLRIGTRVQTFTP